MLPLHESFGMETRGNGMKLAKKDAMEHSGRIFGGMRVVNEWNELAEGCTSVKCELFQGPLR